jgi:Cof subfamily protein (haloacid dehalogenase superfamily)
MMRAASAAWLGVPEASQVMSEEAAVATLPTQPIDIRLVVTDLDGTLLDGDGKIPDRLWRMLPILRERGITLAPASGRQYASLRRLFGDNSDGMSFIAENGTFVVMDGDELSCTPLKPGFAARLTQLVRELVQEGHDLGLVWCGRASAYIERSDERFVAEVARYYSALEAVEDLTQVREEAVKCAVVDFGNAETGAAHLLAERCESHQVVASSEHWVDIMSADANKGAAMTSLQRKLGVTPEQTIVFGDYLNDLEMLMDAPHSFAMANAHPSVIEAARYVAPTNLDHGVLQVLEQLLEASAAAA